MTDEPKAADLALKRLASIPAYEPLWRLLDSWRIGPDLEKRQGYQLVADLARLDVQRRKLTWEVTLLLAPPAWRRLLDLKALPDAFDAWSHRSFSSMIQAAGLSAGAPELVPTVHGSVKKLAATVGADDEEYRRYTKRHYYEVLVTHWGADTNRKLTDLATKHGLAVTELIDRSSKKFPDGDS